MSSTVCLIEDHPMVRMFTKALLQERGYQVTGSAKDYESGIALVQSNNPDIVVVDINLGKGKTGLELTEKLKNIAPNVKVVVFSVRENIYTIDMAYRAGAVGYVTKSSSPELLIDAIDTVAKGGMYFMPGLAEQLAETRLRGSSLDPRSVLSAKELEIFKLLAQGMTHEDIAAALDLSPKSIANRLLGIKQKLNCSRSEFTTLAIRYDLLDISQGE